MTADGPAPEVVEFGADDRGPSRRPRLAAAVRGDLFSQVLADRRLVPVVAGLAAVAAAVSLFAEWRIVTLPNDNPDGGSLSGARVSENLVQIGAVGIAYEISLVALTCLVTLLLFGRPAVRHTARILGLAVAGSTLVLLAAAAASMRDASGSFYFFVSDGHQTVELGRGLTFAFAAVVLAGLAFILAGRFLPAAHSAAPPAHDDELPDEPPSGWGGEWSWRRRRAGRDEADEELAEVTPLDLTVEPASPFARPTQD
jgi:hypothetical protein